MCGVAVDRGCQIATEVRGCVVDAQARGIAVELPAVPCCNCSSFPPLINGAFTSVVVVTSSTIVALAILRLLKVEV